MRKWPHPIKNQEYIANQYGRAKIHPKFGNKMDEMD